jgi:hypothetical protein
MCLTFFETSVALIGSYLDGVFALLFTDARNPTARSITDTGHRGLAQPPIPRPFPQVTMSEHFEYQPKNMPFRRLGASGLRVPVFSLGGCECILPESDSTHAVPA